MKKSQETDAKQYTYRKTYNPAQRYQYLSRDNKRGHHFALVIFWENFALTLLNPFFCGLPTSTTAAA
jgi:hypothetical protein